MLLPALSKARQKAKAISCSNNLHQLAYITQTYMNDSNSLLLYDNQGIHTDAGWLYHLKYAGYVPEGKTFFLCPLFPRTSIVAAANFDRYKVSYGMLGIDLSPYYHSYVKARVAIGTSKFYNSNKMKKTAEFFLIGDSYQMSGAYENNQRSSLLIIDNGSATSTGLPHFRHANRINLAFADGHVEATMPKRMDDCMYEMCEKSTSYNGFTYFTETFSILKTR